MTISITFTLEALVAVGAEELAAFRWRLGADVLLQRLSVGEKLATQATTITLGVGIPLMREQHLLGVKEPSALQASVACDVCKRKR